jgi:hypothetical protein
MRKELNALHERDAARVRAWSSEYGDGINIDTIAVNNCQWHIVSTAQKLGCAVIVKASQNGKTELLVYAVKA